MIQEDRGIKPAYVAWCCRECGDLGVSYGANNHIVCCLDASAIADLKVQSTEVMAARDPRTIQLLVERMNGNGDAAGE